MGTTFFGLINRYRIEEAKKILLNTESIKMEQLAFDLGYNSKATFFKAFKENTNLSPAKFKEQNH